MHKGTIVKDVKVSTLQHGDLVIADVGEGNAVLRVCETPYEHHGMMRVGVSTDLSSDTVTATLCGHSDWTIPAHIVAHEDLSNP